MEQIRIIKRYANRKLYDTYDSRYVKLDELSAMLSEGIDFQIIDNETKEDITRVTLAQILVRNGRKGSLGDSMTSLRGLIVNTSENLQKKLTEPVSTLRTSVEESVNRILKTSEERAIQGKDQFHAWVAQNTLAIDELQKRVEERIRQPIARLDLVGQIDHLSARLDRIETMLGLEPLERPSMSIDESDVESVD